MNEQQRSTCFHLIIKMLFLARKLDLMSEIGYNLASNEVASINKYVSNYGQRTNS